MPTNLLDGMKIVWNIDRSADAQAINYVIPALAPRPRFLKGTQVFIQRCVKTLIEESAKTFCSHPSLRLLQAADIVQAIFRPHSNGRIAAADQDQVHQQPRCAPIAVVKSDGCQPGGDAPSMPSQAWRARVRANCQNRP